jgi:hypothetical protein
MLLTILAAAAFSTAPAAPEQKLRNEIATVDALFDLVFLRCDPERLRALLTSDVEFYHDRTALFPIC